MTGLERLPSLSPAARRMRNYRERHRRKLTCVMIQVRALEVDRLIARHLLAPEQRADRTALAKAIHTFFDMTLGRTW